MHEEFCALLGSRNVYFQPPESVKMQYDCIRYSRSGIDSEYADDKPYKSINEYQVIVITRDPDSPIPDAILGHFQMCSFVRAYTSNNLNHTILNLFY